MSRDKTSGESVDLKQYVDEDFDRARADVEAVKTLLQLVVQALVDQPQAVRIEAISGSQAVIFEVKVDREDVRRVIGRKGRTADALREIMLNLGSKVGRRFLLEILEPEGRVEEVPASAAGAKVGATEVIGRPRIRLDLGRGGK